MAETMPPWVAGLLRPEAYPHPAPAIRLMETHISWVFLAGELAYKIKKPVNFGFLDFSTLDRRRFFCGEEVRLNRRYAPDLYLDVVPITEADGRYRVAGEGGPVEFAVRMRRFDDSRVLARLARDGEIRPEWLDDLAARLADFHAVSGRAAPEEPWGAPERQQAAATGNFVTIRHTLETAVERADLECLAEWTEACFRRGEPLLRERKQAGFIRECHGDLHLGNVALIGGRPTLFDGIEFNADLRWIDVQSEVAFLMMDLEAHGFETLAWRFYNAYLEQTGDFGGVALLDYYRVYRAMVRAKVARLRQGETADPDARQELGARYRRYVGYARRLIQPRRPVLLMTFGLAGSGKSWLARHIAAGLPAVLIRSDVERKRLAGFASHDRPPPAALYDQTMTARTYGRLEELAGLALSAGHSVIVDAGFLRQGLRERFWRLAEACRVPAWVIHCQAPLATLRARVAARAAGGGDASDADAAVLENQLALLEPLTPAEERSVIRVDTGGAVALDTMLTALREEIGR